MENLQGIHICSEIGKLKRVLLHRPGRELDNLTPDNMASLLFDDIPDTKVAASEHDKFAEVLRQVGADVVYAEDLLAEVLQDETVKNEFLQDFIAESGLPAEYAARVKDYFLAFHDVKDVVEHVISGVRAEELPELSKSLMPDAPQKLLWIEPMTNLYFTRDPMTAMGSGVALNAMWSACRRRETLIFDYLLRYHHMFQGVEKYYDRSYSGKLEGGDMLILSPEVLAVGVSQRTDARGVEVLAKSLLQNNKTNFAKVLAFMIPHRRAFMHLDTVFTMIDRDIFTIHPEVEGPMEIYEFYLDKQGELKAQHKSASLHQVLCEALNVSEVELIRCGGNSLIDAQREQWSDGSNTLAVAPGEVVVYDRNYATNRLLEKSGVKLHAIKSSEISRGRGGPRCMSMPLWREDLK